MTDATPATAAPAAETPAAPAENFALKVSGVANEVERFYTVQFGSALPALR